MASSFSRWIRWLQTGAALANMMFNTETITIKTTKLYPAFDLRQRRWLARERLRVRKFRVRGKFTIRRKPLL
jgi:hypothetical protein